MNKAIVVIAICEVIRTIQITVELVLSNKARKTTLESITKVGDSVAADFKPEKIARAVIKEATNEV